MTPGASCTHLPCSRPWAICCVLGTDARPLRVCLISGWPCWVWSWEPPATPCSLAMPPPSYSRWTLPGASTRRRWVLCSKHTHTETPADDLLMCHRLFDLARSKSVPIVCLRGWNCSGQLSLRLRILGVLRNLVSLSSDQLSVPPTAVIRSSLIPNHGIWCLFTPANLACDPCLVVTNNLVTNFLTMHSFHWADTFLNLLFPKNR